MIISRTPFRISFFGGGTDYPAWYLNHGGEVLATAIDKYCYITCRFLPPFFEHKFRIVYSKIEDRRTIEEIEHPAARETLTFLNFDRGVEIHHDGDLPARSGMGTSSSFTVGLLHALYALKGQISSKRQLAMESVHIEQDRIGETVGSQDQFVTAYGGLNHVTFAENGEISIKPVTLSADRITDLNDHLMLFYTGIVRTASDIAETYIQDVASRERQLHSMRDIVTGGLAILNSGDDLIHFGKLLDEAWQAKRGLGDRVSNSDIDEIYAEAQSAGAVGGKLLGAGGGGFMVLFVHPSRQAQVKERLNRLIHVPFKFDSSGSQIIFFDHEEDYSSAEQDRASQRIQAFRELV